jgi:prepilin-type N-terminal cleavage/methylation domain-containing protein
MNAYKRRQSGFSLIEVLLATGILGVGLILIAMVFPVGIKLTGVATERTIGVIAANEAVAKVQLWGLPPFADWTAAAGTPTPTVFPHTRCAEYLPLLNYLYRPAQAKDLTWEEFLYPSVSIPAGQEAQKYHWSALCYGVSEQEVLLTVFVTRTITTGMRYYTPTGGMNGQRPIPVKVVAAFNADDPAKKKELMIVEGAIFNRATAITFFDNNVTIVDDRTGRIYRVQEYKASSGPDKDTLVLTETWEPSPDLGNEKIWVIPPGIGSGRNPVIDVTQTTIRIKN